MQIINTTNITKNGKERLGKGGGRGRGQSCLKVTFRTSTILQPSLIKLFLMRAVDYLIVTGHQEKASTNTSDITE